MSLYCKKRLLEVNRLEINFNHKEEKKMSTSRDTQRRKVYNWENTELKELGIVWNKSVLTKNKCELFIVNAIRWWGREKLLPKLQKPNDLHQHSTKSGGVVWVKFRNYHRTYGGNSYYILEENSITLRNGWALNKLVCLHEAAHLILDNHRGQIKKAHKCASHGPEFMRIYLTLLARFTPLTMSQLTKSARNCKIKISGLAIEGFPLRP